MPQSPSQIAASTIESPANFSTHSPSPTSWRGRGEVVLYRFLRGDPADERARTRPGGLHGGVLGLCRDAHPICRPGPFWGRETAGAGAEELRGQGGRYGRSLHADLVTGEAECRLGRRQIERVVVGPDVRHPLVLRAPADGVRRGVTARHRCLVLVAAHRAGQHLGSRSGRERAPAGCRVPAGCAESGEGSRTLWNNYRRVVVSSAVSGVCGRDGRVAVGGRWARWWRGLQRCVFSRLGVGPPLGAAGGSVRPGNGFLTAGECGFLESRPRALGVCVGPWRQGSPPGTSSPGACLGGCESAAAPGLQMSLAGRCEGLAGAVRGLLAAWLSPEILRVARWGSWADGPVSPRRVGCRFTDRRRLCVGLDLPVGGSEAGCSSPALER
ncbi:hypothetical protein SUDANB140_07517 (plasmid) [Streptomyces sp. enrichment culture]